MHSSVVIRQRKGKTVVASQCSAGARGARLRNNQVGASASLSSFAARHPSQALLEEGCVGQGGRTAQQSGGRNRQPEQLRSTPPGPYLREQHGLQRGTTLVQKTHF